MDVEYVVAENIRFGGQITQICNIRYVDVIMQNYNNKQLAKFRNSCFSYFEDLQGRQLQFSGKLVHQFLLNIVRSNKANEVWLRVNGQLARFGMQEYCLITGLLCHDNPNNLTTVKLLEKHRLRRMWLNNSSHISLNELEAAFISCDHEGDKYKLGLALLIEGVLRPMDRKRINIETLSLVENLDVCYEYPWGRHCFFTLLRSLLTSWERRAAKASDKSGGILKYTIYGFPFVFQLWMYEVCPQIGETFAVKVQNTFPRILNWDAHHQIRATTISDFFKSTEIMILPILQPTEEEAEQPYAYTMVISEDTIDARFDAVVYQFVYDGHEFNQIGEEMEQVNQQDIAEPVVNIPEGPSYSGYDYAHSDDYATNERLNSLFAEQRSYFDHQLASIRNELLQRFDHLESLVSSSSSKNVGDKYQEMQQYMDTKFNLLQVEQSAYLDSLRDDLHRKMQSSLLQIPRMFERMMVDKHTTGGGDEMECEAVPINHVVHHPGGNQIVASSSISSSNLKS